MCDLIRATHYGVMEIGRAIYMYAYSQAFSMSLFDKLWQ